MKEPFLEPFLRYLRFKKVIFHIPKFSTVLDIGCGVNASFLKLISSDIKEGYGIDFKVKSNINIANIKTSKMTLDDSLPFADNSFEVVTMLAVLEHIEKEQEILGEIYRVLKPNGKLVITVPSIWAKPVLEFLAFKINIVSQAEIKDHKRYYTRKTLQQVLNTVGFKEFQHHYFQLGMNNFSTVTK